jgi:L-ascorbate metabolism protein UlaG (beta-lactamase superfamily)
MIDRIQWLGHGSFRIEGPPLIYINPWRISRNASLADVVLITNDQYDHCSPADVDKLRGSHTQIIANPGAAAMLGSDCTVLRPWQSLNIGAARITAVPAYTFTHHHPVSRGGLGFIISLDYYDTYYAGCTDVVPELSCIQADIVILPVGESEGTMTLDRSVDFVNRMRPSWVIPSHGTSLDAQALARALDGQTNVMVFEKNFNQ